MLYVLWDIQQLHPHGASFPQRFPVRCWRYHTVKIPWDWSRYRLSIPWGRYGMGKNTVRTGRDGIKYRQQNSHGNWRYKIPSAKFSREMTVQNPMSENLTGRDGISIPSHPVPSPWKSHPVESPENFVDFGNWKHLHCFTTYSAEYRPFSTYYSLRESWECMHHLDMPIYL